MGSELKPCPFCGGGAYAPDERDDERGLFSVFCATCAASAASQETRADAIAAWNARPLPVPDADLEKRAREVLAETYEAIGREADIAYAIGCRTKAQQIRSGVATEHANIRAMLAFRAESQPFDAHALANHEDFGGTSEAGFSGYYETDPGDPVIPPSMKPWHGRSWGPPKDHDYGPVMRRDGKITPSPITGNQWLHVASHAAADIIAYTPKAPAPAVEGEWVIVPRHATHNMLAAAHDGPLMAADYTMEPKGTAWLQEMWAAFLSAVPGLDGRGEIVERLEEVRDLLLERIHGNPARSASHNARVKLDTLIATLKSGEAQ